MDGSLAYAAGVGVQWSALSEYLVVQEEQRDIVLGENRVNSSRWTISERAAVSKNRDSTDSVLWQDLMPTFPQMSSLVMSWEFSDGH